MNKKETWYRNKIENLGNEVRDIIKKSNNKLTFDRIITDLSTWENRQ